MQSVLRPVVVLEPFGQAHGNSAAPLSIGWCHCGLPSHWLKSWLPWTLTIAALLRILSPLRGCHDALRCNLCCPGDFAISETGSRSDCQVTCCVLISCWPSGPIATMCDSWGQVGLILMK